MSRRRDFGAMTNFFRKIIREEEKKVAGTKFSHKRTTMI
jgi:hypothetical protein